MGGLCCHGGPLLNLLKCGAVYISVGSVPAGCGHYKAPKWGVVGQSRAGDKPRASLIPEEEPNLEPSAVLA